MTAERLAQLRRIAKGLAVHAASKAFIECLDAIESLQAENAELRKDRERLDWIQSKGHSCICYAPNSRWEIGWHEREHTDFRAAIDAAREKKP